MFLKCHYILKFCTFYSTTNVTRCWFVYQRRVLFRFLTETLIWYPTVLKHRSKIPPVDNSLLIALVLLFSVDDAGHFWLLITCLNARFSSYYPNTIPFILGAKSIVNHKGARLIEMVLIQQLKSLWRVQTSCTEIFLKLFHQPTVTLNNIF